eukprot:GHVR01161717.1.p1 GENE.GHVR01161717.1~~GHVR01161717.1.p1  ORF type:complete len:402 (+),score=48.76 GHVR01161717.1:295-1500(+)
MANSQNSKDIIPFGYGTWVYDEEYGDDISAGSIALKHGKFVKSGLFKDTITAWNEKATGFPYTQIFSYGGDIEMYCRGSGQSDQTTPCTKANGYVSPPGKDLTDGFLVTFPGDEKDQQIGLKNLEAYLHIPKVAQNIIIIDGRVDLLTGTEDEYLDYINALPENEATYFADKVSKAVCGNNNVAGVQFDIEPFSFTGEGGKVSGNGQKFFYNQIAKNFASDTFGCVNSDHPNGRIFSIFTFAKAITPDVKTMLTQYGNGYVMDSLYDLGPLPGGQLNSVKDFKTYALQEIQDMKALNIPYQFAIPAAASAHEFETRAGKDAAGAGNQIEYVKSVIELIKENVLNDPNFKGIGVWSYNQKMYWPKGGDEYTPASPSEESMNYLDSAMPAELISSSTSNHDEL